MAKANVFRILKQSDEDLFTELTNDERLDRGNRLAETLEAIRAEESRAEMVKASLKSAMTALEAKRDELSIIVRQGKELRRVQVETRADDKALKVLRVRLDSGAVLSERDMNADERQEKLALVSTKSPA